MKPISAVLASVCLLAALSGGARSAEPQSSGPRDGNAVESQPASASGNDSIEPELLLAIPAALRSNPELAKGRIGPAGLSPSYAGLMKMSEQDLQNPQKNAGACRFILRKLITLAAQKGIVKNPAALGDQDLEAVLYGYAKDPAGLDKPDKKASGPFVKAVMQARAELKQKSAQSGEAGGKKEAAAGGEEKAAQKEAYDKSVASAENRDGSKALAILDGAGGGEKKDAVLAAQRSDMGNLKPANDASYELAAMSASKHAASGKRGGKGKQAVRGKRGGKRGGSGQYSAAINKYAAMYGLSPQLVRSVITQESHYNSGAVSPKGARGLMQVMPATGKWMAQRMGMKGFSVGQLHNPDVNVRIGCAYLKYLNGLKKGNMTNVLRSYNGGPGRHKGKKARMTSGYASSVMGRMHRKRPY